MKLGGKKIILGITGSIAAYKTAELVRLLVKEGAVVQVVMTSAAKDFVTPLTLSTLSDRPVLSDFFYTQTGEWNNHVALGLWADALLIAPASANTLSKMASGQCPDLLSAVYLSARCPVFVAPAMDLDMFSHPATAANLDVIRKNGAFIIGPESGQLASGLQGTGRMTEPNDILAGLIKFLSPDPQVAGKKVLVTAGPTREAIDPVRYISNHSSGKMGVAVANELLRRGALVTLVAGPGVKMQEHQNLHLIRVESAVDMYEVTVREFKDAVITVMAAAVADYAPAKKADQKIKKQGEEMQLQLMKTPDILSELGKLKTGSQFLAGFALETQDEIANATAKLNNKKLDLIVLNSLNDPGAGFGTDTNKITIIDKKNQVTAYDLKPKAEVAADIVDKIIASL